MEKSVIRSLNLRGYLNFMESFLKVCEDTRKKLGRQLQGKEKEFLQWMYDNYKKEQEKDECKRLQSQSV